MEVKMPKSINILLYKLKKKIIITLTISCFVCSRSVITPSVIINKIQYFLPSSGSEAARFAAKRIVGAKFVGPLNSTRDCAIK